MPRLRERNGQQYSQMLKKSSCLAYVQLDGVSLEFGNNHLLYRLPGDPLAKSVHACLFSRSEQLPVAFGRHVGKWNKFTWFHVGELLEVIGVREDQINVLISSIKLVVD